jgi:hypothetical protein
VIDSNTLISRGHPRHVIGIHIWFYGNVEEHGDLNSCISIETSYLSGSSVAY